MLRLRFGTIFTIFNICQEIRGTTGTFFQLLINLGILYAYVVGAFMSVFWASVVCGIIPLIFGAIFFFMPESPVYLIAEKREPDAVKSFKWLRGSHYDPLHEINDLKQEIEENERLNVSFGEIIKKKATQRALMIGFGLMFFQQMCGINVVIFNATTIFKVGQN